MRYETENAFKRAVERKLGVSVSSADWEVLRPLGFRAPYSTADINDVLSVLQGHNLSKHSDAFIWGFEDECARLSWMISYALNAACKEAKDLGRYAYRDLLEMAGWYFLPLGEYWAWSWFYEAKTEHEALTLETVDAFYGLDEYRLMPWQGVSYPDANESRILYHWEFFWKAVARVSAQYRRPAIESLLALFWPSRWRQIQESHNCDYPDDYTYGNFAERRAAFLEVHPETERLTTAALRTKLERQIWGLHRDWARASGPAFGKDDYKNWLAFWGHWSGTWEQRRQNYEIWIPRDPDARHIATAAQFAVEAKRAHEQLELHKAAKEHAAEYLQELGPRWTLVRNQG